MNGILIQNAKLPDGNKTDLLLENGTIARVISCGDAEVIDAHGLCIAPGLVDMHVHLRDPGFTAKEDILSGCRAAAAGGVTSLVCMPNTGPALDSAEIVRDVLRRAEAADARVYVAAAVSKGLQGEELVSLRELKEAGAIAVSDDGRPVLRSSMMAEALREAQRLGLKVLAHCEDLDLAKGGRMNEGEISARLGIKGIPAAAEDCGTAREIALAAAYGAPVHICHVSTKNSVAMVREAKRRGVPVTAETAPHYFALTERELLKKDADSLMNPPLRKEEDRLAVVEGLRDGTIGAIATDHAPHTPIEKVDFESAPSGVVGMETSLAAGITFLVKPGILTLQRLLELMSASPAKLLGIDAGRLGIGAPADVILFDPDETWTVDPEALHGKSKNAVFKGMELAGKVKLTVCRGKVVYRGL